MTRADLIDIFININPHASDLFKYIFFAYFSAEKI